MIFPRKKVNAENAIRMFLDYLDIARKDKTIHKPISNALYRTWTYFDAVEKERKL